MAGHNSSSSSSAAAARVTTGVCVHVCIFLLVLGVMYVGLHDAQKRMLTIARLDGAVAGALQLPPLPVNTPVADRDAVAQAATRQLRQLEMRATPSAEARLNDVLQAIPIAIGLSCGVVLLCLLVHLTYALDLARTIWTSVLVCAAVGVVEVVMHLASYWRQPIMSDAQLQRAIHQGL